MSHDLPQLADDVLSLADRLAECQDPAVAAAGDHLRLLADALASHHLLLTGVPHVEPAITLGRIVSPAAHVEFARRRAEEIVGAVWSALRGCER